MTEEQADKAHWTWQHLHELLNQTVFAVIDVAELTAEQEEYVIRKLHEEHRYWRKLK